MTKTEKTARLAARARYLAVFIGLIAAFAVITVWNINSGSVRIPVKEIARIIFLREGEQMNIIWKLRMPRIIAAAVLGGGLALSGFLMQTFFGNPIAGPFVLGISSGSKLFVAMVMIVALRYVNFVSSWMMVIAAFVGPSSPWASCSWRQEASGRCPCSWWRAS